MKINLRHLCLKNNSNSRHWFVERIFWDSMDGNITPMNKRERGWDHKTWVDSSHHQFVIFSLQISDRIASYETCGTVTNVVHVYILPVQVTTLRTPKSPSAHIYIYLNFLLLSHWLVMLLANLFKDSGN